MGSASRTCERRKIALPVSQNRWAGVRCSWTRWSALQTGSPRRGVVMTAPLIAWPFLTSWMRTRKRKKRNRFNLISFFLPNCYHGNYYGYTLATFCGRSEQFCWASWQTARTSAFSWFVCSTLSPTKYQWCIGRYQPLSRDSTSCLTKATLSTMVTLRLCWNPLNPNADSWTVVETPRLSGGPAKLQQHSCKGAFVACNYLLTWRWRRLEANSLTSTLSWPSPPLI